MPSPRGRAAKQPTRRPRVAGRSSGPSKDTAAESAGTDEATTTATTDASTEMSTAATAVSTADTGRAAGSAGSASSTEDTVVDGEPIRDVEDTTRLPRVGKPSPTKRRLGGLSRKPSPSPRPRPAAGSAVAAESANTAASSDVDSAATASGEPVGLLQKKWVVRTLTAVTVVCLGLAGWFGTMAYLLDNDASASNVALVDTEGTSSVIGQVSSAVQTVFSYNYTDTGKTEKAAQNLLTGKAIDQYNQLYGQVKQLAPQQKLVLTTTVQSAGVKVLDGDRAELLVFVDQHAVRTDNSQNSSGPAQMAVNAQRINGQWKITNMTVL